MKNALNTVDTLILACIVLFGQLASGCAGPNTEPASTSPRAATAPVPGLRTQQPSAENEAQQHIDKGDEFLGKGDLQSAVDEYTRAISIDSHRVAAFMHRGVAYARLRQYESAVADFTRLIEDGLADVPMVGLGPDVYFNRGSVYLYMQDNQKAIADFSSGIDTASKLYEAEKQQKGMLDFSPMFIRSLVQLHNVRAKAYTLTKEYDKALQDYNEALRLFPEEPVLYRDRAELHKAMGNNSEASKDLERFDSLMQKLKVK